MPPATLVELPTPVAPQLAGLRIAFTGRLASCTRADAVALVESHGGRYDRGVTPETNLLVVGQSGWPLRADGRLTGRLLQARRLQQRGASVEVIREDALLERLGLTQWRDQIVRRHTLDELERMGLPATRVRGWIRAGLLRPAETVGAGAVPLFDFAQVSALRSLDELTRAGITTARLRKSLKQLRRWMPDASAALARLDRLDGTRRLVFRAADGQLLESCGQRVFDFGEGVPLPALPLEPRQPSADELFEQAVDLAEEGRSGETVEAYREWLRRFGPDPVVCFNLANALYAVGETEAAIERFRQATEMDPGDVQAWNNLASVLAERGRRDEAIDAYRRALDLAPHYGDALYNLADTLDEAGRSREAEPYWRAYLAQDGSGPWADYARARLAARAQ